jgi:ectoine hydroxylase-related dioxygenase (phytanoyl-CoA dioxygenase family)
MDAEAPLPDTLNDNLADSVADFARDGVACVRGLAGAHWMAPLREAVAWAMANPSSVAVDYGVPGAPRFFHDVNVWRRHETIRDFALNGPAVAVARALLGAQRVRYYGDHIMVKEPGSVDLTVPWHQDLPYVRATGWQFCSIWVALDHVTLESGAMRFVRGSHRGTTYKPVRFQTGKTVETDEFEQPVPDIDADPARFPTVHFDLAPGDCTVHHANTCTRRAAIARRTACAAR